MVSFPRKSTPTREKLRAGELPEHVPVIFLKRLHRIPVEIDFQGNILDGGLATALPHVAAKLLGTCSPESRNARASRVRNHGTARDAPRPPETLPRAHARDREPTARLGRTRPAGVDHSFPKCFFHRRTSVLTRALGSPKIPRTVDCAGEDPETRKRPIAAALTWLNRPHNCDPGFKHPPKCPGINGPRGFQP